MQNTAQCFKFQLLRVLSIEIVFPKSYCSPLIATQIWCIKKQLLVNVNRFNEAIWKPSLRRAFKDVFLG